MGKGNLAVEILGECFQVDIRGVDVIVNVVEGFVSDVTVGDHDGLEAERFGGLADVDHIFSPDCRLVVGERNGIASILLGEERHVLRGHVLGVDLILMGFGDIPVLTKEASHVATSRTHAENARARKEMIERLFFDGIDLKGRRGSIAKTVQFAILIGTDIAEAGLAVADVAVSRAQVTVDPIVRLGFPPKGFMKGGCALEDLES